MTTKKQIEAEEKAEERREEKREQAREDRAEAKREEAEEVKRVADGEHLTTLDLAKEIKELFSSPFARSQREMDIAEKIDKLIERLK